MASIWTDENVALLRQLVTLNELSAADIAKRIPCATRAAVLGKIKRLRMTLGHRPWHRNPDYIGQRQERATRKFSRVLDISIAKAKHGDIPQLVRRVNVSGNPMTMDQLTHAELHLECRFISNDDMRALLYCGHSTFKGTSWCAAHYAIVFEMFETRSQAYRQKPEATRAHKRNLRAA